MRCLKRNIQVSSADDFVEIVFLGDMHIGHANVDYKCLRNAIGYIHGSEKCLWVGMGDYCDAIVPDGTDSRFDYGSVDRRFLTPQEQYGYASELLSPIADKCLFLMTGNHDDRLRKFHYYDFVEQLAQRLRAPYTFGPTGFMRLNFCWGVKRRTFDVFCSHGYFSGRTKPGRLSRLEDLLNIFDADIYAMGHVHDLLVTRKPQLIVDRRLEIVERPRFFLLTGGFLKGYGPAGSYIERKMLHPTNLGAAKVRIAPFHGTIEPGVVS
jgi:predicted phosphodiesterase